MRSQKIIQVNSSIICMHCVGKERHKSDLKIIGNCDKRVDDPAFLREPRS